MSKKCMEKTEVYSRVVGYFRPIQQWNKGKREEFKDRREFELRLCKAAGEGKTSVHIRADQKTGMDTPINTTPMERISIIEFSPACSAAFRMRFSQTITKSLLTGTVRFSEAS